METSFFHYTMIVFFFQCSKARNTEVNNPIRLEFELIWDVRPKLDTYKFGEDPIKNNPEKVAQPFSPSSVFGCHDNHIFDPIYPQTTPLMLHIKFDQNWQTDLRDIHVWKSKYIYGFFFRRSRARTSKVTDRIRPEFWTSRDLCRLGNQQVWRRSDQKWTLNFRHRKYKCTVISFSSRMFTKNKCHVRFL